MERSKRMGQRWKGPKGQSTGKERVSQNIKKENRGGFVCMKWWWCVHSAAFVCLYWDGSHDGDLWPRFLYTYESGGSSKQSLKAVIGEGQEVRTSCRLSLPHIQLRGISMLLLLDKRVIVRIIASCLCWCALSREHARRLRTILIGVCS